MAVVASNPKTHPTPISSRISRETATKAVDALLKWNGNQEKHKKAQLLDHDTLIHVALTMKKIPSKSRVNPYFIPIPHPLHSEESSAICLFVDDRPNAPVTAEKIRSESPTFPQEVIGLSDLKSDYIAYEARRKLCGSHEVFFADKRILPLLPRLIGKTFFRKKKHPFPLNLGRKGWKEQIRKALGSTFLYIRTGSSCQLNVGRLSMGRDQIVDNVIAAVEGAVGWIPKGWANVRSIFVKSEESIGLPIYQALPDFKLKIEVGKKVNEEDVGEDGEVIQSGDSGEKNKNKKKKVEEINSKKKKKKVNMVRYMDGVAKINQGVAADENNEDADNQEHPADELIGEKGEIEKQKAVKKTKIVKKLKEGTKTENVNKEDKKEKAAKQSKKMKKAEDTEAADQVTSEPLKKRKIKSIKPSEAKEEQAKKSKKTSEPLKKRKTKSIKPSEAKEEQAKKSKKTKRQQ